jgi:hypothetical protein
LDILACRIAGNQPELSQEGRPRDRNTFFLFELLKIKGPKILLRPWLLVELLQLWQAYGQITRNRVIFAEALWPLALPHQQSTQLHAFLCVEV